MAVLAGVNSSVRRLAKQCDDLNALDSKGMSLLMYAAANGQAETCRILLELGADPRVSNPKGQDALALAEKHSHTGVVEVLTEFLGADAEDEEEAIDFSSWEPETESPPPPPTDPSCLANAKSIQAGLSRHVPIDLDEDWSGIEIDLPDQAKHRRRTRLNDDRLASIRALILSGIREGRLAQQQVTAILEADETSDSNTFARLALVFEDLGIRLDDWHCDIDELAVTSDMETLEGDEDEFAACEEALEFFSGLSAPANDLVQHYLKSLKEDRLLTHAEEIGLGQRIEEATGAILAAFAEFPSAIREIQWLAGQVKSGKLRLDTVAADLPPIDMEREEMFDEPFASAIADDEESVEDDDSVGIVPALDAVNKEVLGHLDRIAALYLVLPTTRNGQEQAALIRDIHSEWLNISFPADVIGQLCDSIGRMVQEYCPTQDAGLLPEQLKDLHQRILEGRAELLRAKREMIEANYKLVISIARKYTPPGTQFVDLDLVQEGNIGLMKAVDKFNYRLGYKFSTYATWWIRQAITRSLADQSRLIRIPVHRVESLNKLNCFSRRIVEETGREPRLKDLAEHLETSEDRIRQYLMLLQEPVSLEALGDDGLPLWETLPETNISSPEDTTFAADLHEQIQGMLSELDDRSAKVLRMRFGIDLSTDYTLEEVGTQFNVTRERIRQIEAKALRKLRHPSRSDILRDFLSND